jgi:hypothetical protein
MSLNQEASPGTPGAGYQDTNERDIVAKQREGVQGSEAARDDSIELSDVNVLPGTGGPDDSGDEDVPSDYDPTGHATAGEEEDAPPVDPRTTEPNGTPVENPSG